jgi:hypothetical protein
MTTTPTTAARTDQQDEAAVRRAVQLYADGYGSGDTRRFEEAFHEEAWMYYTAADGALHATRFRPQVFEDWAAAPDRATIRVLEVRLTGDVANVLLVWRAGDAENTYVDSHNLLKIDGVWKITNKTATHISRAGDVPGL